MANRVRRSLDSRLAKVKLESPVPMMYIVIPGMVPKHPHPGPHISAMIIDRLHRRQHIENTGRLRVHKREDRSKTTADGVEEEAFERVVVEGAKGVVGGEAVVDRVDGAVQVRVGVHPATASKASGRRE